MQRRCTTWSPPARGRGSKRRPRSPARRSRSGRPPRGGADRNPGRPTSPTQDLQVAPRAGARIETATRAGRGLHRIGRPPRGGADRNSGAGAHRLMMSRSPPARGRGSKHLDLDLKPKRRGRPEPFKQCVESDLRAWIRRTSNRTPRGRKNRPRQPRRSRVKPGLELHRRGCPPNFLVDLSGATGRSKA